MALWAAVAAIQVLVFVSPECPVSNRSIPELNRIAREYGKRGMEFRAVISDPSIREPMRGLDFPVVMDREQALARKAGATATPEAAVFRGDALVYRGRIDDLRRALDSVLAGKAVEPKFTKVVGCAIPLRKAHPTAAATTFARDVAPILYAHCARCHRPGEGAPFSLLSYNDAAKRAAQIAEVTKARIMPPWKPAMGYGKFAGENRLSDAQIATLQHWAAESAPEGDPAAAPKPPHFTAGWQQGEPDLTVGLPQPADVPAEGPDQYRCFVIALPVQAEHYIRAAEFRPGNPKVVHHALMFLDNIGAARRRGGPYDCFGTPGFLPSGGLGGWTPGSSPVQFPAEAPAVLRPGTDLVLQIHFHPTGTPQVEQSTIGIYFTDRKPTNRLMDVALTSNRIDIPAGERAYKVRDHFTLPVDVRAVGIIPHAHYICKDMKGWAILPDGRKQWLIWIRDWNFNWQEQYRYAAPLRLPEGTRLEMEFTYDNSDVNPRNPSHPPKRVLWGAGTTDEMAGLHLQVMPERPSDSEELGRALWGKIMRSLGGGVYRKPQ